MHRAIVSGITGHLGTELCRQLLAAGVEVLGLTRQESDSLRPAGSLRYVRVDASTETLIRIFHETRPDVVFHLAGVSRREHRSSDIAPFVTANILFGTQLLEAMRLTGCRRMITAGSYLQHYDTDGPRAFNLYAATKLAFEDLVAFYVEAYDISAVRLTLADIYGECDTRPKLMTDIATAWRKSIPLQLRDEHTRIDLIHVEDAATAFIEAARLLESGVIPNEALSRFSVSSGKDLSAGELVEIFERVALRKLSVMRDDTEPTSRRITPRRGTSLPGWSPRISLEAGISRIVAQHG